MSAPTGHSRKVQKQIKSFDMTNVCPTVNLSTVYITYYKRSLQDCQVFFEIFIQSGEFIAFSAVFFIQTVVHTNLDRQTFSNYNGFKMTSTGDFRW